LPSIASPDLPPQVGAVPVVPVDDAAALNEVCFADANEGAANAVPASTTAPAATAVSFSVFFFMVLPFVGLRIQKRIYETSKAHLVKFRML